MTITAEEQSAIVNLLNYSSHDDSHANNFYPEGDKLLHEYNDARNHDEVMFFAYKRLGRLTFNGLSEDACDIKVVPGPRGFHRTNKVSITIDTEHPSFEPAMKAAFIREEGRIAESISKRLENLPTENRLTLAGRVVGGKATATGVDAVASQPNLTPKAPSRAS